MTPLSALQELQAIPHWVGYNLPDKVPLNPRTGKNAMPNNPKTWGSHKETEQAKKGGMFQGAGFVVTEADHLTGIDGDHCIRNGTLAPEVSQWKTRFNSYGYITPSHEGVRFLVHGTIKKAITPEPFIDYWEAYSQGRYFTITDDHLQGTPTTIEDRQAELDAFYDAVMSNRETKKKPCRELDKKIKELENRSEGGRNIELSKVAFRAGVLIAHYGLLESGIRRAILKACIKNGLADEEPEQTERTLSSQLQAGIKQGNQEPLSYSPYRAGAAGNGNGTRPPAAFDLCSFDADDAGNSDALNALYGQDFLYCASLGWLHYTETHWGLDVDGTEVRKRAIETLRLRRHAAVDAEREAVIQCTKADERRVNGCVSLFKTHVSTDIKTFDCDPDVLNCKNGIVNLRTGMIEPHSRAQRFTYCLPVEYELQADSSQWVDYLRGVIGGGPEVIDYVQEALGYSFTGHTQEEILFYLFGPTRSGKGTYAETIMTLLPTPLSKMVDFQSFTAKREGDVSNFDLAPLKPARIIFASESNKSQNLNPAKIKQLTGGDHISCCFKHKDFFSYRPQFKVWMMSNHPVNGDPEDDALWGRVRVIEFPHSFLGMEDKTKKARLKEPDALKGILAWIVQGAARWYALGSQGLITPQAIEAITKAQRADLDLVQQWLDECCEDNEGGWSSNEEVMASYTAWCKNNNAQYPKGSKGLAQSLKGKGYEPGQLKKVGGKVKRGVGGLYIYPENEETI